MNILFFLLPFFLYAGVAAQAAGMYLCAVLLPLALNIKQLGSQPSLRLWLKIGVALFVISHIYILSNLVVGRAEAGIYMARISSTIAISSYFLMALGLVGSLRKTQSESLPKADQNSILASLTYGFVCAVSLSGVFIIYQHITGADFRISGWPIAHNNMMANGFYRTTGFFGHPLSMAGITLALFAFFWSAFWDKRLASVSSSQSQRFWGRLPLRYYFMYVAMMNFIFLYTSGSRMPLVIGIVAFILIPVLRLGRQAVTKSRLILATATLALCGVGIYFSGLGRRFYEIIEHLQSGHFWQMDRFIFWRVHGQMIKDRLWLGHGYNRKSSEALISYYDAMGYSHMQHKYNAHNSYIQALVDTGVVGFLLTLMMCVWLWNLSREVVGESVIGNAFRVGLVTALLVNAVHAVSQNVFYDSNVMVVYMALFWTLLWMQYSDSMKVKGK